MKFKIVNRKTGDSFVIEGETIDELRDAANAETSKRGWQSENCYSEEVED